MFISKLGNLLDSYDIYGEYRVNALKILYIIIILFICNLIFAPHHAILNFILIPILAILIETTLVGARLKIIGTIVFCILSAATMLVYDLTYQHPTLFTVIVLFSSILIYYLSITKYPYLFGAEPFILCIGFLSGHKAGNSNLYEAFNGLTTLAFGVLLILGLLILFPRWFYYRLWLRAFYFSVVGIRDTLELSLEDQRSKFTRLHRHLIKMDQYAKTVGHQRYNFSLTKINLCICKLCGYIVISENINMIDRQLRIQRGVEILNTLITAIASDKPFMGDLDKIISNYHDESSLVGVYFKNIILSWNNLCSRI